MINIIKTRLIHFKKNWISLLFWLVFPVAATLFIFFLTDVVKDDVKVPIGIVLEENTPLAKDLYKAIENTPLIRAFKLDEDEAINQLNKHELDSVFIIRKGYEENVRKDKRDRLIMSYMSDLSIAYIPVSEMIVSYVQQDVSRSKAAHVVSDLSAEYGDNQEYTWDEIIEESKIIQDEQSLLNSTFAFSKSNEKLIDNNFTPFKAWSLWAVFALLSSLLLFDWVIKERNASIAIRFAFVRVSLKSYLLKNFIIYTLILWIVDMITIGIFYTVLSETITFSFLLSILSYRVLINAGAFLFSLLFRKTYFYYACAFSITLITAILSGAIMPVDGIISRFPLIKTLNPLDGFLSNNIFNIWLVIVGLFIVIWYVRKENFDAKSD